MYLPTAGTGSRDGVCPIGARIGRRRPRRRQRDTTRHDVPTIRRRAVIGCQQRPRPTCDPRLRDAKREVASGPDVTAADSRHVTGCGRRPRPSLGVDGVSVVSVPTLRITQPRSSRAVVGVNRRSGVRHPPPPTDRSSRHRPIRRGGFRRERHPARVRSDQGVRQHRAPRRFVRGRGTLS